MQRFRTQQSGFTLTEIIIAISIIAFFSLALTGFLINMARINDRARDLTFANAIAEKKLEELRSGGYLTLSNGTTSFTSELPATLGAPKSAQYVVADSSVGASVKKIDIAISYTRRSETTTVNYSSLVGELGIGQ